MGGEWLIQDVEFVFGSHATVAEVFVTLLSAPVFMTQEAITNHIPRDRLQLIVMPLIMAAMKNASA